MEKKKRVIISMQYICLGICAFLLLAASAFLVYSMSVWNKEKERVVEAVEAVKTFGDYTDCEVYMDVPAMVYEGTKIGEAKDYGNKNYVIDVNGTSKEQYEEYISLLVEHGYKKHSDNGEEGMEGYVYTSNFIKDDVTLTISHMVNHDKTYISASNNLALSDHLNYDADSMKGVSADAKTKLYMLELNGLGSSFVIQLKNGHFIIEDGGQDIDAPYLLDFLEDLVPEGQKPVIEAWFISHVHGDHFGALMEVVSDEQYANRIYVDGIYFTSPSEELVLKLEPSAGSQVYQYAWQICRYNSMLSKENGEKADFYRMALGQRYYFCDISIDISMTLEQIPETTVYSQAINDTTTWMMYNIEGQKVLNSGDGYETSFLVLMQLYEREYFDVDVYTTPHHGTNQTDYFTDYMDIKTVLYTNWRSASLYWDEETMTEAEKASVASYTRVRSPHVKSFEALEANEHLRNSALEYYSHGEGTVVLTFPYTVGTAEIMEPLEWIYNVLDSSQPVRELYTGPAK